MNGAYTLPVATGGMRITADAAVVRYVPAEHVRKQLVVSGQRLLFRCLETGFISTGPGLTRYQQGRNIDVGRRERIGPRPQDWTPAVPTTICEFCSMVVRGNQWTFRQHQLSQRCQRIRISRERAAFDQSIGGDSQD
jgi:hypothetical protein